MHMCTLVRACMRMCFFAIMSCVRVCSLVHACLCVRALCVLVCVCVLLWALVRVRVLCACLYACVFSCACLYEYVAYRMCIELNVVNFHVCLKRAARGDVCENIAYFMCL